jgi:hypothetical protein
MIFFDEFNTNSNISGLFKEILIDRKIMGTEIDSRIVIIAACNPYQKIPIREKRFLAGLM